MSVSVMCGNNGLPALRSASVVFQTEWNRFSAPKRTLQLLASH